MLKWLKRYRFLLIYIPLFVILPYYLFDKSDKNKAVYEIEECGYVHKKFERNTSTSKGRYVGTHLIMVVKYPNRFVEKKVTADTYYRKEANDRVCFIERQEGYVDNVAHLKGYAIILSIVSSLVLVLYIGYKNGAFD
jgi:hypothetical protein